MLRLRVQPRHKERHTFRPFVDPTSSPPLCLPLQEITQVGARILQASAAAHPLSAMPSLKVPCGLMPPCHEWRVPPSQATRLSSDDPSRRRLGRHLLHYVSGSITTASLLSSSLTPRITSCCSFLGFLQSSPNWSSVGSVSSGIIDTHALIRLISARAISPHFWSSGLSVCVDEAGDDML